MPVGMFTFIPPNDIIQAQNHRENLQFYSSETGGVSMKHQSFSSRKSAQKQFVLLLTLTLCLILILNLLLYNHRAQQLYTEQLKKDNYNTALQISREFDASMDLMRTACWNMVHNNREFIRIVETYDNSFEHKTALMSYLSSIQ